MTPKTLDALAGLYLRSASRGGHAPRSLRLDSDGTGLALTVPGPADLADVPGLLEDLVEIPKDGVRRTGSSGIVSGSGAALSWSLQDLAALLVEALAGLLERPDAGQAYRDLRTLVAADRGAAYDYALQVVRSWRRTLPVVERARVPSRRRERTPDAERKRRSRERIAREEEASARWWLDGYVSGWGDPGEAPAPGTRVAARDLYGDARGALEEAVSLQEETLSPRPPFPEPRTTGDTARDLDALRQYEEALQERAEFSDRWESWEGIADDEGLPLRPRVPGRGLFFALADEVLGPRSPRSTGGLRFYTVGR